MGRATRRAALAVLAVVACGGRTVLGDAGLGAAAGGSPADGGVDGLSPSAAAATIEADCMKFCAEIESSFPQCTQFITTPEKPVSCSAWCETSDAEVTTCGAEALAYFNCVLQPGNLQGCTMNAGYQVFVFPACEAAANAIYKCLHPL